MVNRVEFTPPLHMTWESVEKPIYRCGFSSLISFLNPTLTVADSTFPPFARSRKISRNDEL